MCKYVFCVCALVCFHFPELVYGFIHALRFALILILYFWWLIGHQKAARFSYNISYISCYCIFSMYDFESDSYFCFHILCAFVLCTIYLKLVTQAATNIHSKHTCTLHFCFTYTKLNDRRRNTWTHTPQPPLMFYSAKSVQVNRTPSAHNTRPLLVFFLFLFRFILGNSFFLSTGSWQCLPMLQFALRKRKNCMHTRTQQNVCTKKN